MYLSWFIIPFHRETLFSLAHFILIWSFSRVVITKICDPPVFISISHTRWRHWNYIKYFLSQLLTASGLGGELNGNSNDLEKKISSSTTAEVYFQQVEKTSCCEKKGFRSLKIQNINDVTHDYWLNQWRSAEFARVATRH